MSAFCRILPGGGLVRGLGPRERIGLGIRSEEVGLGRLPAIRTI